MTFEFEAQYDDGSLIKQQADTPNEVLFGELDKEKLSVFRITGKNIFVEVNKRTGQFNLNGLPVRFNWLPKGEYEVVYFRRVRVDVVGDMAMTTTQYAIGLKIETQGETSQAIVLADDYGSLTILNKK